MANQHKLTIAVVVVADVVHGTVEYGHHGRTLVGTDVDAERSRTVEVGNHFAVHRPANFDVAAGGGFTLLLLFGDLALGCLLGRFRALGRLNGRFGRDGLTFGHRCGGSDRLAAVVARHRDLQFTTERELGGILHIV